MYQGSVYSRDIEVELPDGTLIELFDTIAIDGWAVEEDLVGQDVSVAVFGSVVHDVRLAEQPKPEIEPVDSGYRVTGTLADVQGGGALAGYDRCDLSKVMVETGGILIIGDTVTEFEAGDNVSFTAGRLDALGAIPRT
jgi:hypothetical protein